MHENTTVARLAEHLSYGQHREVCPFCTPERRKKSIRDLSITVDADGYAYTCHHCGETGGEQRRKPQPIRRRTLPMTSSAPVKNDAASDMLSWLEGRGISPETAEKSGVYQATCYFGRLQKETQAITFPYRNSQGTAYAYKLRSLSDKDFSAKGAAQTFFLSHLVTDWTEIVIAEGEMDALSLLEAGVKNPLSIPNGALNAPINGDSFKLRYLELHADQIEQAGRVVLFLDGDDPGRTTAEEIARRIGKTKCWAVSPPKDCKDANDVLIKHGAAFLKKLVDEAQPWPVEGLYSVDHYTDQVMAAWAAGLQRGEDTGLRALDDLYSVVPGQLTVVTGYPGSGKSELVDDMMVHLAETKGWSFAVCSFENEPRLHIAKLCSKYIGKPFFQSSVGRMDDTQRDRALSFVSSHFSFIHSSDGELASLDSIIDRLRAAVLRYGINGAVIDPYNYIAKPKDTAETEWISTMLSRVRSFAAANGIHVWFVAHPTKSPQTADGKLPVPKGNAISGSAAWWAKADMGITVHRPDPIGSASTEIHVWKVRHGWTGRIGVADVYFNEYASQFLCFGDVPQVKTFQPF